MIFSAKNSLKLVSIISLASLLMPIAIALPSVEVNRWTQSQLSQSGLAEDYYLRGHSLLKQESYQEAINNFEQAIRLNPNYVGAYLGRGLARYSLGNNQGAMDDYTQAIRLNPNYAEAYYERGYLLIDLGDYQKAIEDLTQVIKLVPDHAEAYYERGYARLQQQDNQKAIEDFNQALNINPDYVAAYNNRGIARRRLEDYQKALEDYNQAIKLDPGYIHAYLNRAKVYLYLGNTQAAFGDWEQATKLARQQENRYLEQKIQEMQAQESSILSDKAVEDAHRGDLQGTLQKYQQVLAIVRKLGDRNGELIALRSIGETYGELKEDSQAFEFFQQALLIAREIKNKEEEAILLVDIGGIYSDRKQYERALESYSQSLDIAQKFNYPSIRMIILNNIGTIHHERGEVAKAREFEQQVWEIYQGSKEIPKDKMHLSTFLSLANGFNKWGEHEKALAFYKQALAICRDWSLCPKEDFILNNIGFMYHKLGQYPQALKTYLNALACSAMRGDREGEAVTLNNMAIIHAELGNFSKALELHQHSLSILQELDKNDNLILILQNIGQTYINLDRYSEALEFHQQALAVSQELKNRLEESAILTMLGTNYRLLGKYPEALKASQQALAISQAEGSNFGEYQAWSLLGEIYAELENYPKALESYQQALAKTKRAGNRLEEGRVLDNIGDVYAQLKQFPKALESYQQSLVFLQEYKDLPRTALTLNNMGEVYESLGQDSEAEKHLFEAIQILESLRAGLTDESKVSIFERQAYAYQTLQQVLVKQNKIEAALEISERGRARAFLELLALQLTETPDNPLTIEAPNIQQIKEIAKEQNATLVEYSLVSDGKVLLIWVIKPTGVIDFKKVDFKFSEQQLSQEISNPQTFFRGFRQPTSPLSEFVERSRGAIGVRSGGASQQTTYLPGDLVRLSDDEKYGLEEPWEVIQFDADSQLLVLTNPQFEGTKLERPLSDVIAKVEATSGNNKKLQELYQQLIAPIADLLPSDPNAQVIFIPHRELFLIPFAALQDSDGKYLIDKHTILSAPAIQVLDVTHTLRERGREKRGNPLVVGNPTMPIIPLTNPPQQLDSLPKSEQEAKQIASLLGTQPLLNAQATKTVVIQQMENARLIHLATHGLLDDIRQLGFPGAIALAPTVGDSGFLTSLDILGLKLNADLVVLSACNTGRGRITGDGVVGLSRSLITSGVPSVIVSLWSVPDSPTADLMSEFYQNYLQRKMDKAQALRQAMRTIKEKHPNPRDWAAFTLIGEAESTQFMPQSE